RVEMKYIKGLAIGVGHSEQRRLKSETINTKIKKVFDEMIKVGGTIVLFFIYLFKGQIPKAVMIIKFRFWIISGFFTKPKKIEKCIEFPNFLIYVLKLC